MQTRVERNDPCPCGSGRKAKRCCGVSRPVAQPKPPSRARTTPSVEELTAAVELLDEPSEATVAAFGRLTELFRARPALRRIRFDQATFEREVVWSLPGEEADHDQLVEHLGSSAARLASPAFAKRLRVALFAELASDDLSEEQRISVLMGALALEADEGRRGPAESPALDCLAHAQLREYLETHASLRERALALAGIAPDAPDAQAQLHRVPVKRQHEIAAALLSDPAVAAQLQRERDRVEREVDELFSGGRVPPLLQIEEYLWLTGETFGAGAATPSERLRRFETAVDAELRAGVEGRLSRLAGAAAQPQERAALRLASHAFGLDPAEFLWRCCAERVPPRVDDPAEEALIAQFWPDGTDLDATGLVAEKLEPLREHLAKLEPARAQRLARVQARLRENGQVRPPAGQTG